MSRHLVTVAVAVIALGCGVIGSTIAWSSGGLALDRALQNKAGQDRPYQTKADFDRAFADVLAAATLDRPGAAATREQLRDLGWRRINSAR
jgi:hypothetical protein